MIPDRQIDVSGYLDRLGLGHLAEHRPPESGFVRVATVQRRDATGADVLRGLTLARIGRSSTRTVLEQPRDYYAVLPDVFGLTLDDVTAAGRAALWSRLAAAHERWMSSL